MATSARWNAAGEILIGMTTDMETGQQLDAAFEPAKSRYVIGIDLGTTNCAVAYMDTQAGSPMVELFRVEQMIDANTSERLDTLPSFHYELTSSEVAGVDLRSRFSSGTHVGVVGAMARSRSLSIPGRAIASAKSWLCHTMIDRSADILPWGGDEEVQKISPVEASRRYLEHIRRCWDHQFPSFPMSEQDTIVTLPASFDEVARRLTIEAATQAGITNLLLIEEPQAAFYAWLYRHEKTWTEKLQAGQSILVCDIGGGTTDFTLIRVTANQKNHQDTSQGIVHDASDAVANQLETTYGLHRVAVGEHLMLGGDNLDLALAKALEHKLLEATPGVDRLKPRQWDALKQQCREAKEKMLGATPPEHYSLSLPGSGARLIENTKSVEIERSWVHALLIDGFFGSVDLKSLPAPQDEGFQEFGLPYASEPNILRHLASFLWDHRWDGRESDATLTDMGAARPDWVLFNGGVLESPLVRSAILEQLQHWFEPLDPTWKPGELEGNRLDLAVAQGAAYYGQVRRGLGVRINAKLAKAYYIQISAEPDQAMCVMPANAQPGQSFQLNKRPLQLIVGQPVQFPMFVSSTQLLHQAGDIVPVDTSFMTTVSPIQTVLELPNRKNQRTLPVTLEAELNEIGTLQLQLRVDAEREEEYREISNLKWKLEFDVRGQSTNTCQAKGIRKVIDSTALDRAKMAIEALFGPGSNVSPRDCMDRLAERMECNRKDWEPGVLREMWKALMEYSEYRNRSPEHESRWLNVVGWTLRPGFGMVADDWRVNSTWRAVHGKLVHRSSANQSETVVLWRRIAGGFTVGQQRALYQDVWSRLKPVFQGGSSAAPNSNVTIELLRLIGSLEWLEPKEKEVVVETLLGSLGKKRFEPLTAAMLWTMGRLGTRTPLYASYDRLVSSSKVEQWIAKLVKAELFRGESHRAACSLCLMQWSRRTDDRYRDISASQRRTLLETLYKNGFPAKHLDLIQNGGEDHSDLEAIVGDSLPLGFVRVETR